MHRIMDAVRERLVLFADAFRHAPAEPVQKLLLTGHGLDPLGRIDLQQRRHHLVGQIQSRAIDRMDRRQQSDRRIGGDAAAFAALDDPLQDAQVVAEAGPEDSGPSRRCGTSSR